MLTLFCSWRSDLKRSTQSWDETFLSHTFSKRQEEVMNNFNLRYECLDARDDFHSKLQKDDSIIGVTSLPLEMTMITQME
jgi:hypothetical protein